jgi:hypothetical protein
MDGRDLMSHRADVLFTQDRRGRMLLTNEPDGEPGTGSVESPSAEL